MTSTPRPPRWFSADDVLSGRVNLDGYPFRFIYMSGNPSGGGIRISSPSDQRAGIDRVFSACELLETRGWQVVNFSEEGKIAYLRRVG